jgi:hypothetical protein
MYPALVLKLLALLALANGVPLAIKDILGQRFAYPVDGGAKLGDGRPLFGTSKTVRGICLSLLLTSAGAQVMGLGWKIGLMVSAVAMAGDLCSSFLKRRMNFETSSRATGLDQIPESLFPLLAVRGILSLIAWDIAAGVGLFFAGEVLLSLLLYKLHLRDRPY